MRQALFWTRRLDQRGALVHGGRSTGSTSTAGSDSSPGSGVANGAEAVVQFVTGYLLEWSLSVDNIFVIALIFTYLKIPAQYQYRVLFWGIVGAIVLRGLMIAVGTALLHQFDWMFYVFGAILLLSALRMLRRTTTQRDRRRTASRRGSCGASCR